jgi:serine protease Do
LAAKHGPPPRYKTPEAYPTLNKYTPRLDYEGAVAKSCIHCHQVRDAERDYLRGAGEALGDAVLYPYPMPTALGLALDPREKATVVRVAAASPAEQAGFRPGDQIRTLAGQPLVSIADLQWVLHTAPEPAQLPAEVERGGQPVTLTLALAAGWRQGLDVSWRPTTWALRRVALGGMRLADAGGAERETAGLDDKSLALKVTFVGQFGDHALAKKAGFQVNDLIVEVDGRKNRMTESDLIVYLLRNKRPGAKTPTVVLRGKERVELLLPTQ